MMLAGAKAAAMAMAKLTHNQQIILRYYEFILQE